MHNGQQGRQDQFRNVWSILCVHNTPSNSCATECLEHSRTSTSSNLSLTGRRLYTMCTKFRIFGVRVHKTNVVRVHNTNVVRAHKSNLVRVHKINL